MKEQAIKVTVSDPETGELLDEAVIENNYLIICAGNHYLANRQHHANGTATLTVKVQRP